MLTAYQVRIKEASTMLTGCPIDYNNNQISKYPTSRNTSPQHQDITNNQIAAIK